MNAITTVRIEVLPDTDPDTSYLESDRLAAYQRDEFYYVGIRVNVEVHNTTTGIVTTTTTAGLWGIESDSGEDYLREVAADEAASLDENVNVRSAPLVWR